jgi:NAD(P)-dependent dehydrogenase (short-subunit alcohol dehydrogenase family)
LETISEAHIDKMFNINVKGLLFTVQKALPLFKDGGSMILSASIAAYKPTDGFSIYSATKAAVRSFARSWAQELKQRKIRVNAVSPGPIDTPGLSAGFSALGITEAQLKSNLAAPIPLGRMGSAVEVANTVLFLASDDSSYITGIELFVDGGMAQV